MGSTVPAVKKGLRNYWQAYTGLTTADGVTIRSAPVAPEELTDKQVTLGDVTAPQTWAGLGAQHKTETPTVTGWIEITVPGTDETAVDACRDDAYALLALVEASLKADPSAAGTIPLPRQTTVVESRLVEVPVDLGGGVGGRRAQVQFTLGWTSRI